ncbi:N-6 DNA methylase [Wenjunlia vitaminophila]|uniref:N-6 DNA methylase n=1 Tax=Wenjunlia vitaminophila TaxID=76728 RepID=A0A0T6LSJ6_WENVI|nr:N-6 DNA methylase [Wenjunlia vitaminophila]KRV49013.1 N-6 DNA methylase [Wenjunlia vitaminophila]
MSSSQPVPVSLAEIARIAGVGRAAVSNWRRRHDSFPQRVAGTDASPLFSLDAVEQWLRANGKLRETRGLELLWPRFEALGSRYTTALAIAEVGRRMRRSRPRPGTEPIPPQAWQLIREAVRLGRREGPAETFEFLLRRWLDTHVRQISTTPPQLADLMVGIASLVTPNADRPFTVLDPACGAGHLLMSAATAYASPTLIGCELDPTVAALAAERLAFHTEGTHASVTVRDGNSLSSDPYANLTADVVVCTPPYNERDWGYEELATDPRWVYGLPQRSESELAWVQHTLARLRPGGTAVLLLPPGVASRRSGRRIRQGLLRAGVLRAVVALPPGCAQPHSVSLHLWVLRTPDDGSHRATAEDILLVDATSHTDRGADGRDAGPNWQALSDHVLGSALPLLDAPPSSRPAASSVRVPVVDLLGDEADLTPGRHITPDRAARGKQLAASWEKFASFLSELNDTRDTLSSLKLASDDVPQWPTRNLGELCRAGTVVLRSGQQPPDGAVLDGEPGGDSVPFLTVPDLLQGGTPRAWVAGDASAVVVRKGDVVVVGVVRAFSAWVHQGPPVALGPQLHALYVTPGMLDAHFLAGCLRAPSNSRQAGTHTSTSSRVDVRRLLVLQPPLEDQRRYGEVFRQISTFEQLLTRTGELGRGLIGDLSEQLASGHLSSRG